MYERIKSDESEYKLYSRIRFLGIDRNEKNRGGYSDEISEELSLNDSEFLCVRTDVDKILKNKSMLESRTDLDWLNHEYIDVPSLSYVQSLGIRQVGRLRMMEHSSEFMQKIEQEINSAKSGLNNSRVNVHIFSGLSGETGSGGFLDACYMVRSVVERIGGATILGYFFLPDVNLKYSISVARIRKCCGFL